MYPLCTLDRIELAFQALWDDSDRRVRMPRNNGIDERLEAQGCVVVHGWRRRRAQQHNELGKRRVSRILLGGDRGEAYVYMYVSVWNDNGMHG